MDAAQDEIFVAPDETDAEPAGLDDAEPMTMLLVSRDDVAAGAADQALEALGKQALAPVEVVVVPEAQD